MILSAARHVIRDDAFPSPSGRRWPVLRPDEGVATVMPQDLAFSVLRHHQDPDGPRPHPPPEVPPSSPAGAGKTPPTLGLQPRRHYTHPIRSGSSVATFSGAIDMTTT